MYTIIKYGCNVDKEYMVIYYPIIIYTKVYRSRN